MTPLERAARWMWQGNPKLRGLGTDPRKFARNLEIVKRVAAGERKKDVAAAYCVRPERITQIVAKYSRVQSRIDAALEEG